MAKSCQRGVEGPVKEDYRRVAFRLLRMRHLQERTLDVIGYYKLHLRSEKQSAGISCAFGYFTWLLGDLNKLSYHPFLAVCMALRNV